MPRNQYDIDFKIPRIRQPKIIGFGKASSREPVPADKKRKLKRKQQKGEVARERLQKLKERSLKVFGIWIKRLDIT